jgi:hypothetical protein
VGRLLAGRFSTPLCLYSACICALNLDGDNYILCILTLTSPTPFPLTMPDSTAKDPIVLVTTRRISMLGS